MVYSFAMIRIVNVRLSSSVWHFLPIDFNSNLFPDISKKKIRQRAIFDLKYKLLHIGTGKDRNEDFSGWKMKSSLKRFPNNHITLVR